MPIDLVPPVTATGPGIQRRHARGFWLLAVAFATLMSFTTLPTPLYPLYQAKDGFATFVITLIFAAYGVGVIAGLFLAGHISDYLGRRPVLFGALAFELVSALIFLFFTDAGALMIGRLICGAGIGAVTSTATAYLVELREVAAPTENRRFASLVATVVNTGGLALGPLVGGLLTQWWADPLVVPFAVYLGLLLAVGTGLLVLPETTTATLPRPRYRPQRVRVEPENRRRFLAAAIGGAASFSVMGTFVSLTPSFVAGTLGYRDRLLAGAIVFGVLGSSTLAQVVLARAVEPRRIVVGTTLTALGMVLMATGGLIRSLALFIVSGVVAGAGVGLLFAAAIAAAANMATPGHRGETVAGMFIAAYVGITAPVVAVGVALSWVAAPTAIAIFAAVVFVAAVLAGRQMLRFATLADRPEPQDEG